VEYSVSNNGNRATAVLNVTVLPTANDLVGPAAFVGEPDTYVNEPMHFVLLVARHHPTMKYEIEYGDGTPNVTLNASGSVSPIPDWAGAVAADRFGADIRRCPGALVEHVYTKAGRYTARARVTASQQLTGGRYDELLLTAAVSAVPRRRTLSQIMSTARVYRRLPSYHDEDVLLLFRVDDFPPSLSLSVSFGDDSEPLNVSRMSGDTIPKWFADDEYDDVTLKTPVAFVDESQFYGIEVGKRFAGPGTYDVEFLVSGSPPGTEAPRRALIVARVDVRQNALESQLSGGPLLFAQSPIDNGTTGDLLVVVPRMLRGVVFSVDFGDGTSQTVATRLLPATELPVWLLADSFSSPGPFSLTGRKAKYRGGVFEHRYDEPGLYAAVVKSTVTLGDHCEVFASRPTVIHIVDQSTPPLSELLGDDAIVVPTPLLAQSSFQAFYLAAHGVEDARYAFTFGDGTDPKEGRSCSEWLHIDDSNRTIAGRLPLSEARKGGADTAVCISHVYARPGKYTVRVRVVAPPSGVSQRTWNLCGLLTVLLGSSTTTAPTTPVSMVSYAAHHRHHRHLVCIHLYIHVLCMFLSMNIIHEYINEYSEQYRLGSCRALTAA